VVKNTQAKPVQQKSQLLDDWDNERKKLNVLSAVFVVILAVVVAMVTISVIRGHI
jgi:hypothetical protein